MATRDVGGCYAERDEGGDGGANIGGDGVRVSPSGYCSSAIPLPLTGAVAMD